MIVDYGPGPESRNRLGYALDPGRRPAAPVPSGSGGPRPAGHRAGRRSPGPAGPQRAGKKTRMAKVAGNSLDRPQMDLPQSPMLPRSTGNRGLEGGSSDF